MQLSLVPVPVLYRIDPQIQHLTEVDFSWLRDIIPYIRCVQNAIVRNSLSKYLIYL